jgi:hypothetical protein
VNRPLSNGRFIYEDFDAADLSDARHTGTQRRESDAGLVERPDAHAFVYVLEGSIVMQVRGGKEDSDTWSDLL